MGIQGTVSNARYISSASFVGFHWANRMYHPFIVDQFGPGKLIPLAFKDPGRVWKGKKMPGNMGNATRTVQNLRV